MEINTRLYDDYITSHFAPQDEALKTTLAAMQSENIPSINVSPAEGKLLQVLALMVGAKRILEIGTLGGYSGIHFARALPDDGKLITLEIDAHHAEVARRNFEAAGVAHKVEIRLGDAKETLRHLTSSGEPLFDLIFIDADKDSYPEYSELALPLLRDGGVLLADNTLRGAEEHKPNDGTLRYNEIVTQNPQLTSIVIPILREHGLDGLTVSVKNTQS